MDKVGLELAVFFCLLPLKFGADRCLACLILVLRCLPLSQTDLMICRRLGGALTFAPES